MAEKPKPKRKPKAKLTDKAQSERFKQTAREWGVEEKADFESIFTKVIPPKRRTAKK